jgi:hypothetical protein
MMPEDLSWLEALKQQYQAPHPSRRGGQRAPETPALAARARELIGGIFRAVSMDHDGHPAVIAVIDAEEEVRAATVVLLSGDTELGGDRDLLLAPSDTGLPYEVLAQSDMFGYVWLVQLERQLGRIDGAVVEQLKMLQEQELDGLSPDLRSGPPIVSRADVRWRFKQDELARLQVLTGACTKQLIDGEPRASVDPVAFRAPDSRAESEELAAYVLELTELAAQHRVDLPAWLVERILSDELVDSWRECGLFDAYSNLLSLAEHWLVIMPNETVPNEDDSADGPAELEALRLEILASRRHEGVTSVSLVVRDSDVSIESAVRKISLDDGELIQCIAVPATSLPVETEVEQLA